ncbi:MAG: oligosaccharide flippase family protein [Nitrococcus sp.]|nr:oligosaccharide flippase family protein [Nitrococcus sp.]
MRKGASGAFALQICSAGLGLIAHIVVARLLGVEEYGTYALALTWVTVLTVPALIGQDTSVVRFLPTYCYHGAWDKARGLRRGVSLMVLIASLAIAVLGALIVYQIRAHLGTRLEHTLLAGFMLLPVLTQLQLSSALHRALKRPVSSVIFNGVLRPIMLMGILLTLWLGLNHQLNAPFAICASALAAVFAFAACSWFLARAWPPAAKAIRPTYCISVWSTVGAQLLLISALYITLNRLGVLVIGGLGGSNVVGPYYAAVHLGSLAGYGLTAVNTILAPTIAERYHAGEHDALANIVHDAAWLTFMVTVAVTLPLGLAGYWVLGLFGPAFHKAYVPLLIILAGYCASAMAGPTGYLMTMTRFERPASLIMGGGAVLNVLLCLVLVPPLGMIGAAVAIATATIAWKFAALVFVYRRMNVNPSIFPIAGV